MNSQTQIIRRNETHLALFTFTQPTLQAPAYDDLEQTLLCWEGEGGYTPAEPYGEDCEPGLECWEWEGGLSVHQA